jgi:hypothetical protein
MHRNCMQFVQKPLKNKIIIMIEDEKHRGTMTLTP